MIKLLTYGPFYGQFAASPFCVKAAYLLNMASVEWQRENQNDPRKMRYGKLPAIRVGAQVIPDSDNIRSYLEINGADFDAGLSDLDRSASRAFIRMAEEHMYFHQALDRWGDDRVWPYIVSEYFSQIPKVFRRIVTGKLRKQMLQGAHFQGLGRFSIEERLARLEPDLIAITTRLCHNRFLFGDTPSAADASVAAVLGGMRAGPVETELLKRVKYDSVLSDYVDRMNEDTGI